MQNKITSLLLLSPLAISGSLLAGFAGKSSMKVAKAEEATIASGSQEIHVLNVEDYISPDIEEAFETYAREVLGYEEADLIYETTDTPETMYNYLKTGKADYDLLCPSDYMIQRMGYEGLLEPFDLSLITLDTEMMSDEEPLEGEEKEMLQMTGDVDNYTKYVSKRIRQYLDNCFTDQNCYEGKDAEYIASHPLAIGYMWGTLGIMFNPEFNGFTEDVYSDMQSWDALWNKNYGFSTTIKDSMRDTFAMGLMHKYDADFSLNGETQPGFKTLREQYLAEEITAEEYNSSLDKLFNMDETAVGPKNDVIDNVLNDLLALRSNIRGLEVDTGKNDIVTQKIGVNVAWSGDAVYSMELGEEAENPVELLYSVPENGSNVWFDGWCMPKNSSRSDAQKILSLEFLNFISNPRYASWNMDETGYTSFIAGNDILDLARSWYDCRYDEETEEMEEVDEETIAANLESGEWQEVDLSYFFDGTLEDVEDEAAAMKFYTNEDTGFYLPYKEDGNISVGGMFFCQYPDEEVIARCSVMKDFGKYNEKITKMWEKFKSTSLPGWAIGLLIAEVVAALGVAGYFVVMNAKKKAIKRNRKDI